MRRYLPLLSALLCLAASASAQTSSDGVVDVPLTVPSQRTGVVPTSILPMGALRMESGGVRLPGQPAPHYAPVASMPPPSQLAPPEPAPSQPSPPPAGAKPTHNGSAPPAAGQTGGCVGALDAPLQIQLGAVEGRAAADREADRLMRRHGDLLGGRPTPTDCAVKRSTIFRIRMPVPNPAEGQRLCSELAGRGERCIVVRGGQ